MKLKALSGLVLAATLAVTPLVMAQTAGQDMKAAGHDTKGAAVNTGHATKRVAKKSYRGTKHVAKKTGHGIEKGATATGHATENLGDKIVGKPAKH